MYKEIKIMQVKWLCFDEEWHSNIMRQINISIEYYGVGILRCYIYKWYIFDSMKEKLVDALGICHIMNAHPRRRHMNIRMLK